MDGSVRRGSNPVRVVLRAHGDGVGGLGEPAGTTVTVPSYSLVAYAVPSFPPATSTG
ncbi:UNVERIFIED_ORG: hypothetical protein ABIB52_000349 [Arthrobacter sp. UYCu721]